MDCTAVLEVVVNGGLGPFTLLDTSGWEQSFAAVGSKVCFAGEIPIAIRLKVSRKVSMRVENKLIFRQKRNSTGEHFSQTGCFASRKYLNHELLT